MEHYLFVMRDTGCGGISLCRSSKSELSLSIDECRRNCIAIIDIDSATELRDALTKWIEEQKGE